MLSAAMLTRNAEGLVLFIVLLNVFMLSVFMLSVVMLSVIMLSVVILSVVAPRGQDGPNKFLNFQKSQKCQ
jgi:hypothetical protein